MAGIVKRAKSWREKKTGRGESKLRAQRSNEEGQVDKKRGKRERGFAFTKRNTAEKKPREGRLERTPASGPWYRWRENFERQCGCGDESRVIGDKKSLKRQS